ncbi:transposase zinc-binding domain-containing protein, partial [Acidobacteriota bacterium]
MQDCPAQVYRSRQPKNTPLHRLVSDNWDEFKTVYEDRFERYYGPLRPHVIRVVEEFLRCGLLDFGFTRLFCERCRKSYFLAFSCKQRCLCPSCLKKRQVAFAEFVTTEILEDVPCCHANFTIPKRLRRHFHFDRKLLSQLARCAYETLRDAIREACGPVTPGAVSVIHTAGSMMTFHPHVHLIISSGGWVNNDTFVHAPPLDRDALEELFRHRVFRMLLDEDAITPDVVESMLSWHHSGFDAFIGPEIQGRNLNALENLAEYIA